MRSALPAGQCAGHEAAGCAAESAAAAAAAQVSEVEVAAAAEVEVAAAERIQACARLDSIAAIRWRLSGFADWIAKHAECWSAADVVVVAAAAAASPGPIVSKFLPA